MILLLMGESARGVAGFPPSTAVNYVGNVEQYTAQVRTSGCQASSRLPFLHKW